jgi:hypothetical protein
MVQAALTPVMLKRRLLIAQGPQQLLVGLACLRQRAEDAGAGVVFEDVLVLGDFMAPEVAEDVDQICRMLAKQHAFVNVCSTHDLDARLYRRELPLPGYFAGVLRRIGCHEFDELICTRNTQTLNEVVMHAFGSARRITVGDGLGVIDNSSVRFAEPILPTGYLAVDELQSILPIESEPGLFGGLAVGVIDAGKYVEAVRQGAEALEVEAMMKRYDPEVFEKPSVVVLMTNLTEAGYAAKAEDEVSYFLEAMVPHLTAETRVWIKGHPRHCYGQPGMLVERLGALGYRAFHSVEIDRLPVECLAVSLAKSKLLALHSSSCVTWRLLNPETSIVMGVPEVLGDRWLIKSIGVPVGLMTRVVQTAMAGMGKKEPLSRVAIRSIAELSPRWGVEMGPASEPMEPEVLEWVEAAIEGSRREFANMGDRPPVDVHARAKASKHEEAILGVLGVECCAGERAGLFEQILAVPGAGNGNAEKLRVERDKLEARVGRLTEELEGIRGTWAWGWLRWLFKLERAIRCRSGGRRP